MSAVWARCAGWWRGRGRERGGGERGRLLRGAAGALEEALGWQSPSLSLTVLALANLLFLIFCYLNVRFFEFVFIVGVFVLSLDALETYLRYNHRTTFLHNLARSDVSRIHMDMMRVRQWMLVRKDDYITMRESNPTKAFLQMSIVLGAVFLLGKTISGTMLLYIATMAIMLQPIITPYLVRFAKKIQVTESDGEIDSLIPELSEQNMKELNFEGEMSVDTRQSTEHWLPEGVPPGDISDSSDETDSNSSTTNLLAVKNTKHIQNMETSDESDNEYLPESVQERENLISTVEILPPQPATWSGSAASALWSLGALTGLINAATTTQDVTQSKQRTGNTSTDSSDGFEFIDKSDL